MKLPDVSWVYDYAGPTRDSRYRPPPFCLPPTQKRRRPDCIFSELNTQPACILIFSITTLSHPVARGFPIVPCSEPLEELQEILCVLRQVEELLSQISQAHSGPSVARLTGVHSRRVISRSSSPSKGNTCR